MLTSIKILWIFYKKLLIPAVLFSLSLSLIAGNFGLCFVLIFPLMHYFIYELRLKNEYPFYANFGFSRIFLWTFTLSFAFIIKTATAFL